MAMSWQIERAREREKENCDLIFLFQFVVVVIGEEAKSIGLTKPSETQIGREKYVKDSKWYSV